jgi:type VI secretion system secreted protein VgrG
MGFRASEEFMFFEMADSSLEFSVASMDGTEGLSMLYAMKLELLSEDPDISFDDMIGKGCVITIQSNNHEEEDGSFTNSLIHDRFIHGVVGAFELDAEGEKFTTYKVEVVPKVWPLMHRVNSRIFQKQSIQDIITTLLDELGIESDEYRWDCQETYPPIEYCVQYKESEFDFISRLMEEHGVFYYFEHEDKKHVMVFKDDSSSCSELDVDEALSYISDSQGMVSNQHIYTFLTRKKLTSGKVTLKDYNFLKPNLNLKAEKADDTNSDYEVFEYSHFMEKSAGTKLAKVKLESINALSELGIGSSNVNLLTPGFVFELDDQRRGKYTGDYLITSVTHTGTQAQAYQEHATVEASSYNNSFECIPAETPFRAAQNTNKPIMRGTQTAIVSGPAGEEIYTDEHGRVKVQFHWDRYGKSDENSSCWIRVSQLWAGQGYGGFSLPRIGQEVIVDFIEGNPSNPIITGRVHHGDNRSPYKLPDKKTISTLKTNSSKGGEGFNELRFEDEKGKEQIFIHAERNKDVRVKNNQFEFVGNDSHQKVVNDRFTQIDNDDHQIVKNDAFMQVEGDVHNTIEGDINQATKGAESYEITGDRKTAIKASENIKANMDINLEAGMNYGLNAKMNADIKSGMTINLQAGMTINLKAGASFISIGPGGVQISGPTVMINSGGSAGPASPAKPAAPNSVTAPTEAKEADKAEAGKVEKVQDNSEPVKPSSYGPQAQAVKAAAESGAPFCEQCEAAKK